MYNLEQKVKIRLQKQIENAANLYLRTNMKIQVSNGKCTIHKAKSRQISKYVSQFNDRLREYKTECCLEQCSRG